MSDKYHHGDLKNTLIKEAIKIINKDGEGSLSLRQLAATCGVSRAAPYAHFKSKEDLINTIKNYVSDTFTLYLEEAIKNIPDSEIEKKIIALGTAYVTFFIENSEYYTFLFSRGYIHVNLDYKSSEETNFEPFNILKNLCEIYFNGKKPKLSDYEKELNIIKIWSSVQGLTSIIFMENVKWSLDWKEELSKLLI